MGGLFLTSEAFLQVKDANVIIGDVHFDSHHYLRRLLFSHAGPVNAVCGTPESLNPQGYILNRVEGYTLNHTVCGRL